MISALIGGFAAVLAAFAPGLNNAPAPLAWWGTLYPEFCFVRQEKVPDVQEHEDHTCEARVKLSLWLAKAFDW